MTIKIVGQQFFGVEIEMTGITRSTAATKVAEALGVNTMHVQYVGGSYDAWEVRDGEGRKWTVMSDGSIKAFERVNGKLQYTTDRNYKVEVVTPKLKSAEDMDALQNVVRVLRAAGAVSDAKYGCGIHVHVDAANHTHKTLTNLVYVMAAAQDAVAEVIALDETRMNEFCQKIDGRVLEALNAKRPDSLDELKTIWYELQGSSVYSSDSHYNGTRYRMLNLHNVWFRGTVEFRCFNGTLHAGKIKAYAQFCLGLSAFSINHNSPKASARQVMSVWNLKDFIVRGLKMTGDEFKTCRYWMGGVGYASEKKAAAKAAV